MNKFNQYDLVKIVRLNRQFTSKECMPGTRTPKVGDQAYIVEIYDKPKLGYELESVNEGGQTDWLVTIDPADLDMELVSRSKI